ncbi:MAG TPA: hypothetical protein VE956_07850 [Nodularia sp. (in: cyanobacteria)]|nr:hypothetical protein [Nodularia sp. (in: cyanobacteria)]
MSINIRLLQFIKKYGVPATAVLLVLFGGGVTLSECGGFVRIKLSDSVNEVLFDKRNCKDPTIADTPGKPLALDHTKDSTENDQPQVD